MSSPQLPAPAAGAPSQTILPGSRSAPTTPAAAQGPLMFFAAQASGDDHSPRSAPVVVSASKKASQNSLTGSRSPSPPTPTKVSSIPKTATTAIATYASAHAAPMMSPRGRSSLNSTTCIYETALINARRRIPYSLGTDALPALPVLRLKEKLSIEDEARLSVDMEKLFTQLLPSTDSTAMRRRFLEKLSSLMEKEWPTYDIHVYPFGSTENLLCSDESDLDVCIATSAHALEDTCMLARFWAGQNMERVICVPAAKVPIVKVWDPEFKIACDMNINNTMALENTRMIKTYVQIDSRVRPLAMIVKHWAKQRQLNDAAGGGTLSSYSWICLIINFLQRRSPPILPALHKLGRETRAEKFVNGVDISFCDDMSLCEGFGKDNKESLGALLFYFFKTYAYEFDYDHDVVSVRQGRVISKYEKGWDTLQNNRFCIEEPMTSSRNLGNTVDDISAKGIQLEFRRAYEILLNEVNLGLCADKFEFPVEDGLHMGSMELGLGLSVAGNAMFSGRMLGRSMSTTTAPAGSAARPFPRGGYFRSQSYGRKPSTGSNTYAPGKNNSMNGGIYPPHPPQPMYKMPSEYMMMPVYVSPDTYASSAFGNTAPGSVPDGENTGDGRRTKSTSSPLPMGDGQFGYVMPAAYYVPNGGYSSVYTAATATATATESNENAQTNGEDGRELSRARSLSPRRRQSGNNPRVPPIYTGQQSYYSVPLQFSKADHAIQNGYTPRHAPTAEYLHHPQHSSESGSDLSDISPDAFIQHTYSLSMPPDCRLDDNATFSTRGLRISRSSDDDDERDDDSASLTTDSEGGTFVAQKAMVDVQKRFYKQPEERGERTPVIVNGDLSGGGVAARTGLRSYADAVLEKSTPKKSTSPGHRSRSRDGDDKHSPLRQEELGSSLTEYAKRNSGTRSLSSGSASAWDDDADFWVVSGTATAVSTAATAAATANAAVLREAATKNAAVMSYSAVVASEPAAVRSSTASSGAATGKVTNGTRTTITSAATKKMPSTVAMSATNQWEVKRSRKNQKMAKAKKEEQLSREELIGG
ncbi:uncharacterized protein V1518DRAFT_407218 [Limtongia smithiae]|uniref:uncharacterized protein n=1 Tax=Limtongia smithiae TaxID=1125753 RepID=UPI0034CECB58